MVASPFQTAAELIKEFGDRRSAEVAAWEQQSRQRDEESSRYWGQVAVVIGLNLDRETERQ